GAGIQPEAGKAQVGRQLAAVDAAVAVIERDGVIGQFLRLAVDHVEHAHRRMEVQAEMEKLGLELSRLVGPQRVVLAVADGLVLVPVQLLHRRRQHPFVALVWRLRQRAGLALERGEIERLRLADATQAKLLFGSGAGRQGRNTESGQGQRGAAKEIATMHAVIHGGRLRMIGTARLTVRWMGPPQRWQWPHHTDARWPMLAWRSTRPHCLQASPSRPYTSNSCSK